MITVCELSFDDAAHVPFNAGLLTTVHAAHPKEEISFYGAAQHIHELKQSLEKNLASCIIWNEIKPASPDTPYMRRFLRELSIIRVLWRAIPKNKKSRLLFTSSYPSTVLAVKTVQRFSSKRSSIQVVIHGMTGVIGKRYRNPIRRFQDATTALAMFGNQGIQYVVLEKSIQETILKRLPFLVGKVEVLEHPISPNEIAFDTPELTEPVRFGFLGLADKSKGFPAFLEVANSTTSKYGRRAEFHVVGRYPKNGVPAPGAEALTTKPGTMFISRAEFLQGVRLLHFIVLPHKETSYTLTTSGVLLDAVALQRPVIARKIPIFEAMFEKYGDIGYLFSDDKELKEIVSMLLEMPDGSRYSQQVRNLRNARKARAPESLAATYREICRKSL